MPRPDSIVTENEFPLDQDGEDALVPDDQPFGVLVMWKDLSESPHQYIERLNAEVMDAARDTQGEQRAKVAFQQRIDRMGEFVLLRDPENEDRTNLVHQRCGHVAGVMTDKHPGTPLDRLYERTVAHDCSITGLIQHAGPGVQQLASRLLNLLEGRSTDTITRGYLVALTDLLWDALELPVERRRDVAEYLWDSAGPGDMPWSEEN